MNPLKNQSIEKNKAIIESVFELAKKEVSGLVNVPVIVTNEINNSGFWFELDEEHNAMTNPKITIGGLVTVNKKDIDYINNTFGINFKYDLKTALILTILHEIGHYVDDKNQKDFKSYVIKMETQYEKVNKIKDYNCAKLAYRQIPAEYRADKFAVDFMLKYFPELC